MILLIPLLIERGKEKEQGKKGATLEIELYPEVLSWATEVHFCQQKGAQFMISVIYFVIIYFHVLLTIVLFFLFVMSSILPRTTVRIDLLKLIQIFLSRICLWRSFVREP